MRPVGSEAACGQLMFDSFDVHLADFSVVVDRGHSSKFGDSQATMRSGNDVYDDPMMPKSGIALTIAQVSNAIWLRPLPWLGVVLVC